LNNRERLQLREQGKLGKQLYVNHSASKGRPQLLGKERDKRSYAERVSRLHVEKGPDLRGYARRRRREIKQLDNKHGLGVKKEHGKRGLKRPG